MKFKKLLLQCRALCKFQVIEGQIVGIIGLWLMDMWSDNCILWIPVISACGTPNECWVHTLCSCIIVTWRLGLQASLVAHDNILHEGPKQVYACSYSCRFWPCGPRCLVQHLFSSLFVLLRFFQWIFTKLESSVADEVKILLLSALSKVN